MNGLDESDELKRMELKEARAAIWDDFGLCCEEVFFWGIIWLDMVSMYVLFAELSQNHLQFQQHNQHVLLYLFPK